MKNNIRKQILGLRRALSDIEFWRLNDDLLTQLCKIDWSTYRYIHLFLPIKENREIDTFEILAFFKKNYPQINIVVPRSNFENGSMEHILFDHEYTILKKNKFNIPEPVYGRVVDESSLDVVLVPLLAVDKNGNRVGYGGGFYDRFLANCRVDCKKIGLSLFPISEVEFIPDEFDIKLDICVTPSAIEYFVN